MRNELLDKKLVDTLLGHRPGYKAFAHSMNDKRFLKWQCWIGRIGHRCHASTILRRNVECHAVGRGIKKLTHLLIVRGPG
jgi:hypothetical protein